MAGCIQNFHCVFSRNGVWEGDELDLYYPIFMTVKFLFFFGWLRVAETLYNPFGEDDEDFELNELIQRHFKVDMHLAILGGTTTILYSPV